MRRLTALALCLVLALTLLTPALAAEGDGCAHTVWVNGVCAACGMECDHPAWEDGRCVRCHIACDHPEHDRETQLCLTCGEFVAHTYVGGHCPRCGKWPALQSDALPKWLFAPCGEKGTVQTLSYQTHDYITERAEGGTVLRNKQLCVYLPYGYTPAEKYDVLILLHGMGDNERYWLLREQEYYAPPEPHVYTTDLLDNMMAAGLCRKMLIVTPTFYPESNNVWNYNRQREQEQFLHELRRDILPLIVNTYSTWAPDDSWESLSGAREHFAYAGLSMGSIYGYNAVLPLCRDLFAWYGCFSGSEAFLGITCDAINAVNNEEYPILFFYNSCGVYDGMQNNHKMQYQYLLSHCPCFTESVNATFTDILSAAHSYSAWGLGLYNFLLLLFQQ